MEDITIGFVPRERFSAAARSLRSIFEHTHLPFHLIFVDCNTPPRYRKELMAMLEGHPSVDVVRTDRYLLANAAKNVVVERNESDYLALVENDVVVRDGWLTHLLNACEEHPADVALPLIIEEGEVHFDRRVASIRKVRTPEGEKIEFVNRPGDWEEDRTAERRTALTAEAHTLLFKKEVLDKIGPFDERLTTRRFVDLTLRMYEQNVPIVFEPKAVVEFCSPPPVHWDERDYYMQTWSAELAQRSNEVVKARWNIVDLPSSEGFARERRRWYTSHLRYHLLKFAKRVHGKSLHLKTVWKKRLGGAFSPTT